MEEQFLLRKEPLLEFRFLKNGFQFTDASEDNTSSFFEYHNVSNLEARERSYNWWLTLFDFILGVFLEASGDSLQEDGRQIRFKYGTNTVILLLNNCDWKNIIKTRDVILSKLYTK